MWWVHSFLFVRVQLGIFLERKRHRQTKIQLLRAGVVLIQEFGLFFWCVFGWCTINDFRFRILSLIRFLSGRRWNDSGISNENWKPMQISSSVKWMLASTRPWHPIENRGLIRSKLVKSFYHIIKDTYSIHSSSRAIVLQYFCPTNLSISKRFFSVTKILIRDKTEQSYVSIGTPVFMQDCALRNRLVRISRDSIFVLRKCM